ncbi:MAG: N-carbamoylputrescine amidase [Oscillospiraceae bacterium]|jgi:N-carbamoylputrescine amidase
MGILKVAAIQMRSRGNREENIIAADTLVRKAAADHSKIILLPELFETNYFCQEQLEENFKLAVPATKKLAVQHFSKLARELKVVLPVSFFERDGNAFYNSLAILDADGQMLGIYRKSHIPDGPGYQEKYYFNPGDTGFQVFDTAYGRIGCGICWDQWFPELVRILVLKGAEILFYPTAIGSEPLNPTYCSRAHWQTCIQGHAAANMVPIVVSNRVGEEQQIKFYGSSFLADEHGQIVKQADTETEGILSAEFDFTQLALKRRAWGLFRDRRPDLYRTILSLDGSTEQGGRCNHV